MDDSIIRGNTMRQLVAMLFEAERPRCTCASPRLRSCHRASTGSTWPTRTKLAAAHRSVEQMRETVGATSLHYLSLQDAGGDALPEDAVCRACFTRLPDPGARGAEPGEAPLEPARA